METLLEVKDLVKHFPIFKGIFKRKADFVHAVNGVSFSIKPGEVVGMVGESGCGKSTIGRCIMHLEEPSRGSVHFMGEDLSKASRGRLRSLRREIQMVFQNPYASLSPRKSIADNIGEALLYHKLVKTRKERDEEVERVLTSVGLSQDVLNRYPHEFSGGQQQRVCIGRAIALRPKLIVCDEAVSALDVSVQAQIINLLKELKESLQLSYLFISHDLSVVRHLCDRVIVLYLGRVVEEGSVEEVFSSPKHPYTQALLSSTPKSHPREEKSRTLLKGEIPSPISPPSGCPFWTRCSLAKEACKQAFPEEKRLSSSHKHHCLFS